MQNNQYPVVAKFLHWLMAFLILSNYVLGLSLDKTQLYDIHKQIGLTILILVIIRISWRLTHNYPKLSHEPISKLDIILATSAQHGLYLLMFILPLSGYLMVNANGYSLDFLGLLPLPNLIGTLSQSSAHQIKEIHKLLAHTIVILAALHMLGGLIHHFINKNDILRRML